jgi:hypothetical protein
MSPMSKIRGQELLVSLRPSHLVTPLAALIMLLALVACGGTTPPGANIISGAFEGQASYLLLDWQEGLRIMIWDDAPDADHHSSGSGSTTDPIFYQEGGAQAADGRGYAYTLETADGIQADFAIDGVPYDLERGKVFLIRVTGDGAQIQQLDLDLSGVSPTNDGIVAFGRETPEIAALMAESAPEAGVPEADAPEAGEPEATAQPTPMLTATAQPSTAAPGSATGIAELDLLAEAILSNDVAARRELVRYTTAGCTTADGLGGPPKCDPGQAEGTPVDYLPVLGPGEGVPVLPEAIDDLLDFPVGTLYAAFQRTDEPIRDIHYAPGEYGLFFTTGEGETNVQFILVHADDQGYIVRIDYLACPVDAEGNIIEPDGMTCSPQQVMAHDAGEVLLAPQ